MLLLDFCNIKEWGCSTVLDLYKKHKIIHSEWGKRDGFEKFCVSKYQSKSPLGFAMVEASEIEPWLSGDNGVSPSKWLGQSTLFPFDKRHSDIWDYLQLSQGEYRSFLDKCAKGTLDLNFINDIIEDFQSFQGLNFVLVKAEKEWETTFNFNKEFLKTIEGYIDWEIVSLFLNKKPGVLRKIRKCAWCGTYFISTRQDQKYCDDKCSSTKRSHDFRKTGKHTEYMRKNTVSGVYIKVNDRQ